MQFICYEQQRIIYMREKSDRRESVRRVEVRTGVVTGKGRREQTIEKAWTVLRPPLIDPKSNHDRGFWAIQKRCT